MFATKTCPSVSHATRVPSGPAARVVVATGHAPMFQGWMSRSPKVRPPSVLVSNRMPRCTLSPAPRYDTWTAPAPSAAARSPQHPHAPSAAGPTGRGGSKCFPPSRDAAR